MSVLWLATACYRPPDLPLLDEVPLVPSPGQGCRDELDDVEIVCTLDGDTFDLGACGEGGERFRMLGIDTPEIEHPGQPAECWGDVAAGFLAGTVTGEDVTITFDRTCVDVYGRSLGYVWILGDLFLDLVRDPDFAPYAWQYPYDPEEPAFLLNEVLLGEGFADEYPEEIAGTLFFQKRLDEARASAQQFDRGLWGACGGPQ